MTKNSTYFFQVSVMHPGYFLSEVVRTLPPNAVISFEGDFSDINPSVSKHIRNDYGVLKRRTLVPQMDFGVIPMQDEGKAELLNHYFRLKRFMHAILHVLVLWKGEIILEALDQFHPESVFLQKNALFTEEFIAELEQKGVVSPNLL